ncbi:3181_t:CDS:2, partial [Ambispora leptoticha]
QIREVLVEAKYRLPGNVVQKWQEKAKIIELNSGSINYLTNMSQKEVKKKEKEEILVRDKKENSLETVQQQLQKLDIATDQQNQVASKQEEMKQDNSKTKRVAKRGVRDTSAEQTKKDKATIRLVRYNNWVLEWETQYNSNKDNQNRLERSQSREKEEKILGARRKREKKELSEEFEYKKNEAKELAKEETTKNRKKNIKEDKEAKQKRTKNKEETS